MVKSPADRQKDVRKRRKALRLCTSCGLRPHIIDRVKCIVCNNSDQQYNKTHKAQKRVTYLKWYANLKDMAFVAYGGYQCNCCHEMTVEFLSLDHINSDGAIHRAKLYEEHSSGTALYAWLRDNQYPPGFQVLCMNCNFGKQRNGGHCPHEDIAKIKPKLSIV